MAPFLRGSASPTRPARTRPPAMPAARSTRPATWSRPASAAQPGEVVFTGCGTEADNLAVLGIGAPPRRRRGVQRGRAPRRAAPGRAPRRPGGRRRRDRAWSTSTRSPTPSTPRSALVSVMLANNEVGTVQPLAEVAAVVRRAGARRRRCTPTPCRASAWLDVAAAGVPAPTSSPSAPTSSAGRRASARWCVRDGVDARAPPARRRPGARAPQRHATTWPASWPWPRRCALDRRRAGRPRSSPGRRACATGWSTACWSRGARRWSRPCPAPPRWRASCPRLHRGRRERGAAVPARPRRRVRVGRLVVRERRHGAVPRARGHGRAARRWPPGRVRLSLGAGLHRRRRRPRPRRACPPPSPGCGADGRPWPTAPVLVAMSGGVDSSVAAALLRDEGHEVVGVTMKLWGGETDTRLLLGRPTSTTPAGSPSSSASTTTCSTSATTSTPRRRSRTCEAHRPGRTPNPCIECNRHLKFDRLLRRAELLGFDAVATGHHARVVRDRRTRCAAGAGAPTGPRTRATSCTCSTRRDAGRVLFPVGD